MSPMRRNAAVHAAATGAMAAVPSFVAVPTY